MIQKFINKKKERMSNWYNFKLRPLLRWYFLLWEVGPTEWMDRWNKKKWD